jgi:peptidoglycan/xylan/chitin deacetylase (PgdA/CDA1 family)
MKKITTVLLTSFLASFLAGSLTQSSFASGDRLPPNEMGEIMMLMYHQIRSPEKDYVRSAENFRRDLEDLYNRGYRLANLNDIIDGNIKTEEGRTPFVLTFDDAAYGQINKIQSNGSSEWDPDCAVGIILEFAKKHPDMGVAGTFYVNPFTSHMEKGESSQWGSWMKEMVSLGFEFGNHTVTHPILAKEDPTYPQVEKEIGGLQAWVHKYLPDYHIRTMALPFGVYPLQTDWAVTGTYEGETYNHEALMKVGANPTTSPFSKEWSPLHLARIRAQDVTGDLPVSGYWIDFFDKHPEKRFVSDGDPQTLTIPASAKAQLRADFPKTFPANMKVVVK